MTLAQEKYYKMQHEYKKKDKKEKRGKYRKQLI